MPADPTPLRIALVAPPMLTVPPKGYAGTERVIAALADELTSRGHAVTLFAAGDSEVNCELVPTVPQSLWSSPEQPEDLEPYFALTVARVWREHERFDVIHSHLEAYGLVFALHCPTPVVTTLHGRLDVPGLPELLDQVPEIPLVSISDNQRRWFPHLNWVETVHHGLPLASVTYSERVGGYLALVGRMSSEKGIAEAIELARATGMTLRVAAKMRHSGERKLFRDVLEPAVRDGVAEYLGEVGPTERDALYAGAYATLMLGGWPEPFGLVAIESLAAGTPLIARRAGALPEIVEQGVDGFLVDDVMEAQLAFGRIPSLDRRLIRQRALLRFSPARMADRYERVYRRVIEQAAGRHATSTGLATIGSPAMPGDGARVAPRSAVEAVRGRTRAFDTVTPSQGASREARSPLFSPGPSSSGPHSHAPVSASAAHTNGGSGNGHGYAALQGNGNGAAPRNGSSSAGHAEGASDLRSGRGETPSGATGGGDEPKSSDAVSGRAEGEPRPADPARHGGARPLVPVGPGRSPIEQEERMNRDQRQPADPIAWRAVERGMRVDGSNGERLGTVQDVVADDDKDIFHGIVVDRGGRTVLVSQDAVRQLTESGVTIALDEEQVDRLPTFDEESKQPL